MNIQQALLKLRRGVSELTFMEKGGKKTVVSSADLFGEAAGIAGALQRLGVSRHEPLLLQIDGVKNRVLALWACWLGGFIPVSCEVFTRSQSAGELERLRARHHGARVLTDLDIWSGCSFSADITALGRGAAADIAPMEDGDIALAQYTSGTTSAARCALLTGSNLYVSGVASSVVARPGVRERYFNWLPLNHIFGIAAQHLVPLVNDFDQYHMHPSCFLDEPALWAREASDYRATVSGAAQFALELIRRDADKLSGVDLSSMNVMFVGGGDLSPRVLRAFARDMEPYGWRRGVLLPAYGLTEASMGVCYTPPGEDITVYHIDPASARIGSELVFLPEDAPGKAALERVCLGVLDDCNEASVRSNDGRPLEPGRLGGVFIRGGNVMRGYLDASADERRNPDALGWLDTGDLGFLLNGRLTVFSRKKDVVIHNGVNYARDYLEQTASLAARGEVALAQIPSGLGLFAAGVSREDLLSAARAIGLASGLPIAGCAVLSSLPKTAKGAFDRLALAVSWEAGMYDGLMFAPLPEDSGETQTARLDDWERSLCELWSRALGLSSRSFGPRDDFFALGGDSLRLIDLACFIEDETGLWLEPEELAGYPSFEKMLGYTGSRLLGE